MLKDGRGRRYCALVSWTGHSLYTAHMHLAKGEFQDAFCKFGAQSSLAKPGAVTPPDPPTSAKAWIRKEEWIRAWSGINPAESDLHQSEELLSPPVTVQQVMRIPVLSYLDMWTRQRRQRPYQEDTDVFVHKV